MKSPKILLLVEGEKTEKELFDHFYNLYNKSEIEIVPYKTNIYKFYKRLKNDFSNESGKIEYELIDLPLFLDEYLKLKGDNRLNEMDFIEIILVFDFDPQDPDYSPDVLMELMANFTNSTENGKLYLNFPMVESFKDLEILDDSNFECSTVSLEVLKSRMKMKVGKKKRDVNGYKYKVEQKTCIKNIEEIDKEIANKLLDLHHQKVNSIVGKKLNVEEKYLHLCEKQCDKLECEALIWIVNTSILHLLDEYGFLK